MQTFVKLIEKLAAAAGLGPAAVSGVRRTFVTALFVGAIGVVEFVLNHLAGLHLSPFIALGVGAGLQGLDKFLREHKPAPAPAAAPAASEGPQAAPPAAA